MEEKDYLLEEIKAELVELILWKNLLEISCKYNVGKKLLDYPELAPMINNEGHYYLLFAEQYDDPEEAIKDMGKICSWAKIKIKLKENEKRQENKKRTNRSKRNTKDI